MYQIVIVSCEIPLQFLHYMVAWWDFYFWKGRSNITKHDLHLAYNIDIKLQL